MELGQPIRHLRSNRSRSHLDTSQFYASSFHDGRYPSTARSKEVLPAGSAPHSQPYRRLCLHGRLDCPARSRRSQTTTDVQGPRESLFGKPISARKTSGSSISELDGTTCGLLGNNDTNADYHRHPPANNHYINAPTSSNDSTTILTS